jgi:predicted site-specific integrase-resolvase
MREPVEYRRACPQKGRLRDGMGAILGYARVSTGDQDVAAQILRLTQAGALKVFSDTRSGRTMERFGLGAKLLMRAMETRSRLSVWTALVAHSANCSPR